jgi:hypothetical protein
MSRLRLTRPKRFQELPCYGLPVVDGMFCGPHPLGLHQIVYVQECWFDWSDRIGLQLSSMVQIGLMANRLRACTRDH